jgi:hypothetical protein
MNPNDDVVYRSLRFGSLRQPHPGRSRRLIRHDDRLHRPPACLWQLVIFRIPNSDAASRGPLRRYMPLVPAR